MYQQSNMQLRSTSPVLNTSAMIVGIIGLLLCMIPGFGTIAPAMAILLAVLGRGNQLRITGQGLAGLIMGIVGLVGNIIFMILYFVAIVMTSYYII